MVQPQRSFRVSVARLRRGPSWVQDVFDSDGVGLPRLMGVAGAAAMGLVGALVASADPTPLRIGLALVMVSPWMLDLSRWSLPRLPFAVVAALAAWALIGNTSSSLAEATLIYLATYMGFVGTLPESLLVLALCAAWPLRGAWVQRHIVQGWYLQAVGSTAAWTAGAIARHLQRVVGELRAAQAELAGQAALAERQRIAREIHDVVAHSLAVTMLHLTGARMALGEGNEVVRTALVQAERAGRQSMADIRRTVGLLAPGSGDGAAPPAPGISDIDALVQSYRAAGMDLGLEVTGDPGPVSLPAGLGLYRILQESLTNAAKHAPGHRTEISLSYESNSAWLKVTSQGPSAPSAGHDGMGIPGMRQRAELLGGELCAGPTAQGWVVESRLPLVGEATAS
ncbi:MAG: two-component sensor histidine kinase [Actinobacteria bacterium]|nr:MAG: two-component sensor histidine kinase [Actinomycetota bacterium]